MHHLKAIDFFCGGGGMTCGLQNAGIKVVAGIDIDQAAELTYRINNTESVFILRDIKKLPLTYLHDKLGIENNDDNMIFVGCSPCQYYSIINTNREKAELSKDLLIDFGKFIKYYLPGYVIVENVPGIVTNKESVLPKFISLLKKLGYKYDYDVVDLSYHGVPQARKRYSLIASRLNDKILLPVPDKNRKILSEFIGEDNGFPKIKAGNRDESDFNHTVAGLSKTSLKRLEKTPLNGGTRLSWKHCKTLQLDCFKGKDDSFVDTYGRMSWDKPASTITTKFFSISNGRFGHPEENRAISIREGATLQTFPKTYVFKTPSISATARLIGNAVPPEFAKRLGEIIIKMTKYKK